jgi:glycosyltransferase involved in cell wall biosynthesis
VRIGVDATCWENTRGYGRHARALLTALVALDHDNDYTFVLDTPPAIASLPAGAGTRLVRSGAPTVVAASARGHRAIGDMWRVGRALSAGDFDVVLFPTIYSYVPVLTRARKIIVIHDVIADTYPQLTLPSPTARILWKAKVAAGLRQADAIVTVSDFSRDGIVQRFGIQPERIAVVGEASDPVFRRLPDAALTTRLRDLGVPEAGRLVVYVGGFSPHKNLEPLVDAVASLASRPGFEDIRLVMVGEHKREVFHSYFDVVARRVAAAGLANRTIFTGYLADEDVVVLLNRSAVLALPSLIEGFGLPAVEAAACGCPVVATTASPLPGLLGDGAICVDPREPGGLAAALERVLASESLQASMRKAGLDAAGRLTWEAAARQMLDVLRSVAAR